jgi:hypothetical protein
MKLKRTLTAAICLASIIISLAFTSAAYAWGPITHMSIVLMAGEKSRLPVADNIIGTFVTGSTEPDIGVLAEKTANYDVYHDPVFVAALVAVANRKPSPEKEILLARAMGYATHIKCADIVAHAENGYSNNKVVLPIEKKPHHRITEFIADVLSYSRCEALFKKCRINFIDAKTLIEARNEYAKIKGISLVSNEKEIKGHINKHLFIVTTYMTVAKYLVHDKPQIVSEMDKLESDRFDGISEDGGITRSVDNVLSYIADRSLLTRGKDRRNIFVRADGFFAKITKKAEEKFLGAAEGAAMELSDINAVKKIIRKMLAEKLEADTYEAIADRFFVNVILGDDQTLDELLYMAEYPTVASKTAKITSDYSAIRSAVMKRGEMKRLQRGK